MRVAFFVSEFPYLPTPYIGYQAAGLIERGHDVQIFASRGENARVVQPEVAKYDLVSRTRYLPPIEGKTLHRFAQACPLFGKAFRKAPVPALRSLNSLRYGRDARRFRLLAAASTVLQDRREFDIIHCNFGPNGNLATMLREIGAISGKLITVFHRYDIDLGFEKGPEFYAALRKRGDCFIAISQDNRNQLLKLGFSSEKIHDLHVGIHLYRFAFREPRVPGEKDRIEILTIARLTPVKGLEYGLQAFKSLRERFPHRDLHYTIVGYGELEKPLKELASKLGLDACVHFTGAVDAASLVQIMRDSDIFMLPSLAEGLPAVLMEAMAIGLPIVATDVSAVAELVLHGQTGFVVPPADFKALESNLAILVESPNLWRAMAQKARARVEERHDAHRLNDQLIRIYRTLLD